MPFKPGQSGNKAGRPKGSTNKESAEVKQGIAQFISGKVGALDDIWESLETGKEKALFLTKLLPYIIPKQTEILTEPENEPEYDWSRLSFDDRIKLMRMLETASTGPVPMQPDYSKLSVEELKILQALHKKMETPKLPTKIDYAI